MWWPFGRKKRKEKSVQPVVDKTRITGRGIPTPARPMPPRAYDNSSQLRITLMEAAGREERLKSRIADMELNAKALKDTIRKQRAKIEQQQETIQRQDKNYQELGVECQTIQDRYKSGQRKIARLEHELREKEKDIREGDARYKKLFGAHVDITRAFLDRNADQKLLSHSLDFQREAHEPTKS